MTSIDWNEIRDHYRVKDREFPMLAADEPTFMGLPHARTAADLAGSDVVILGAPYVAGARGRYAGVDKAVYVHFDMDVLGGAGPVPGDILGDLAEPIGMTDYEGIRIAYEVGRRGLDGLSFICIPPGSPVVYRTIVYVIVYLMAGLVHGREA